MYWINDDVYYGQELTDKEYEEGKAKLASLGYNSDVFSDRILGEGLIILYNRGIDLERYKVKEYVNNTIFAYKSYVTRLLKNAWQSSS